MDDLKGGNVPIPVATDMQAEKPRFQDGDVMPNGTVFDSEKHVILKNGVVRDKTTGQFVCAPAPEHAPITQSNAKAVAKKRWDASREAFAAGVAQGMGKTAPVEAWSAVGVKAAELLNKATSARGFADLARFTGEAAGFVPMARGREEMQESTDEQPQIVNLIFQFVQAASAPADVIEGEVKE